MRYALINDGETKILTGAGYALERQTKDGWEPVPLNMWFTTVGVIVESGQRRELSAPLPGHAGPGRYRFRTTFRSGLPSAYAKGSESLTVDVTAELRINRA